MATTSSLDRILARCRSWDDFVAEAQRLENTTRKGHLFERLTQLFLQTDPTYASKLKKVWWHNGDEVPARVRRQLRLPKADEGIDLVAQTRSGDFWAIQAKYRYDSRMAITRESLGTFHSLTFAHCVGFSLGLVAHTTAKPISKRELLDGVSALGLDVWLGLTDADWTLIHQKLEGESARPRAYTPRKHQERAVAAAAEHFLEGGADRGRLIMPCGTGKSLTAYWIARKLEAKTVVVAVPSLALIKQSVADWTREFLAEGIKPDWLCVCSSADVGKLESDDFVASTYETGLDTTTDVERIAAFLSNGSTKHRIVFVTYQSSRRLCEAAQQARCTFDLAILDEAHKTVGAKTKSFATLLHADNLDVKHRISMTATERVLKGGNSDHVLSMEDDAAEYGKRFFELSFKEAIEGVDGDPPLICDYRILTVTVSETRIAELVENRRFVELNERLSAVDARELAAGLALKRATKNHGVRHAISFHRSIAAAKRFAALQDELDKDSSLAPQMTNLHISSKNSVGERAALMKEFSEQPLSLITNARCLTEGVDVPKADCVLFADSKQSVVDIVQAAGRAMRLHDEKEVGYILLPLIVPDGIGLEEFADTTEFRQVARTIVALSTQDKRIAEEFRLIDRRHPSSGGLIQFEGDVPVGVAIDLPEFAEKLRTKVWERVGRANWRPFEEARAFVHGAALANTAEWKRFARSDALPADIPRNPNDVYRLEWQGFGDWLGTGAVANADKVFRPFDDARRFVRTLGLRDQKAWRQYAKTGAKPADIPQSPDRTYVDQGWAGYGDWLGTGRVAPVDRVWMSYEDARAIAKALRFDSAHAYREWASSPRRPDDIPYSPELVYEEWSGWGDFFGTGSEANYRRSYRPFDEARSFVRGLNLASVEEWHRFAASDRRPSDIPSNPNAVYPEWSGYGDWLGTQRIANFRIVWRPFPDARSFVRGLGLAHVKAWREYVRTGQKPDDIPTNPATAYRSHGWSGWGDWLGSGRKPRARKVARPFPEAREFAQSLGLKSSTEWREFSKSGKRPKDIPAQPNLRYGDAGWVSWGDWLGTGGSAPYRRTYRSFEEARTFARSLELKSGREWTEFCRSGDLPSDIPRRPGHVYRSVGWQGMGDWLGTGTVAAINRVFRPFEAAREYARGLGLRSQTEWVSYCKSGALPNDIPRDPRHYVGKGWISWPDWLGTAGSDAR